MAYARVVVDVGPAHLDRLFDYRLPEDADAGTGSRVQVRFNGRPRTAWVAEVTDTTDTEPARIKPVDRVDGTVRWFTTEDLALWRWVADRYAGTMSGAIRHALPPRVVRVEKEAAGWGPAMTPDPADRPPCASDVWRAVEGSALLRAAFAPDGRAYHLRAPLQSPGDAMAGEGPHLADLVGRCVAGGRQALVLVPSPAPGPADDVVAAMGSQVADLRGSHTDADRYRAFLRLQRREVAVAVGERGLALMPLPALGLVIVVDEASPAYKEQRNPRHHVREAALARARMAGATAVLTSSVLSAQARRHAVGGHLTLVRADRQTERAQAPTIQVIDRGALAPSARRTRLVGPVSTAVRQTLDEGGRVIVLAAAKGSGTSLACADCRSRHECPTCGGGVAPGSGEGTWRCAACTWEGRAFACVDCGSGDTFPLRAGARRFAAELARTHPDAQVVHMEGFDQAGPDRRPSIAVMTRGSVVARPTWLADGLADLLGIADPDVLLGRPDVEAAEDALRLWMDAARLARRIVVQTAQPTHPALQALVRLDPDGFWTGEHERRAELGFPPAGSLIRLTTLAAPEATAIRRQVPGMLLGPDADGAALLKTSDLRGTLTALTPLRQDWAREDRRIRVDVDPVGTI
ncbi:primosomal protein N' [soil metagenome]